MTDRATRTQLREVAAAMTTVGRLDPDDLAGHATLLRELRDREAIRDLVQLYTRAVDDYDLDTLVQLFAQDGVFERRGRAVAGHEQLRTMYAESMRANETMVHTPECHVVHLLPGREAVGWATGHAELVIGGTALHARFRYADHYRCVDDRWLFAHRSITFKHAVPFAELTEALPSADRMRWPGSRPGPGDYPETLPGWAAYRPSTQ